MIEMTLIKICMNFGFWWNKHALQFFFLKKPESERNKFSHFKIFREKSRESSFLLHRSTKLKHTDSIFVPSFFCCIFFKTVINMITLSSIFQHKKEYQIYSLHINDCYLMPLLILLFITNF